MSRLIICWMTGLLGAGATVCQAQTLKATDPGWAPIMAQARLAAVKDMPAGGRLTMNRIWSQAGRAQVCGVSADASGSPVLIGGRMQLKRIQLKQGAQGWQVARTEQLSLRPGDRMDAACRSAPQPAANDMAVALREMEKNPPAAGTPTAPRISPPGTNTMPCHGSEPTEATSGLADRGVVARPGRSLLHSVPDLSCYIGKFIVEGDKVTVLSRTTGWAKISYTHPVTHVTTVGWLKSERVARRGTEAPPQP